jgi:hypothetical protein
MERRNTVREESRREVGTLDMAYSTLPSSSFFFLFFRPERVYDAKRAEDVGRPRRGFYSTARPGGVELVRVRAVPTHRVACFPSHPSRARRAVWPGRDLAGTAGRCALRFFGDKEGRLLRGASSGRTKPLSGRCGEIGLEIVAARLSSDFQIEAAVARVRLLFLFGTAGLVLTPDAIYRPAWMGLVSDYFFLRLGGLTSDELLIISNERG